MYKPFCSLRGILKSRKGISAETYRDAIVEIATDLINKPSVKYRSGRPDLGQSPETGFDCSGFVRFVLTKAGLFIPDFIGQDGVRRPTRHANEFWDTYGIAVHDGQQQRGDLIFFTHVGQFPKHVGIVRDEESYINAPGQDGTRVEVSSIVYETIPDGGREGIIYLRNPIGFKSPSQCREQPTPRLHQRII